MEQEKIKLTCAVLCEGKYDKIKLSSVIDGTILTTDGFSIFNNAEKKALLRKLCETRGIVIITDSDRAGIFIRSRLLGFLPKEKVRHLYIPELAGKEKRKDKPSKDGLLGVEGMEASLLRDIIKKSGLESDFNGAGAQKEGFVPLTKADLYEYGLSGGADSAKYRALLLKHFELPSGLSANAMLSAFEMLGIGKPEVEKVFSSEKNEKG